MPKLEHRYKNILTIFLNSSTYISFSFVIFSLLHFLFYAFFLMLTTHQVKEKNISNRPKDINFISKPYFLNRFLAHKT